MGESHTRRRHQRQLSGARLLAAALCCCTLSATAPTAWGAKPVKKEARPPLMERLTCRTGPNDHQARLIAEVVKGRAMEFAFYSRLGTRVCSINGRRGDAFTQWEDIGGAEGKTEVKLLEGAATIEYKPGFLRLKFADVGRMRYCGMYGELNGSIEAFKGKAECGLDRIFEGSNEEKRD